MNTWLTLIPKLLLLSPLACLLFLLSVKLIGLPLGEQLTGRLVTTAMFLLMLLGVLNIGLLKTNGPISMELAQWYKIGSHSFHLLLDNNLLNAIFAATFLLVFFVVAYFSKAYLHQEAGFFEYYALFLVFSSAVLLTTFSANMDSLFVGWELVGLTSVLLIGFFRSRPIPTRNSLYTLVNYRLGEMCLLTALIVVHILLGGPIFLTLASERMQGHGSFILLLILCACYVKSAQLPFGTWLPRAMEGPTPSSAIFYGGVSTHLGPLLLLKLTPLIAANPMLKVLLIANGILTALYASVCGRTKADIKSQLAYATMAQLGVIFMEIGLGFYTLATFHCIAHCLMRTFQYLRSPSIFDDQQRLRVGNQGFHIEKLYPASVRAFLYHASLSGFFIERMITRWVVQPFFLVCKAVGEAERYLSAEETCSPPLNRGDISAFNPVERSESCLP